MCPQVWKPHFVSSCQYTHSVARRLPKPQNTHRVSWCSHFLLQGIALFIISITSFVFVFKMVGILICYSKCISVALLYLGCLFDCLQYHFLLHFKVFNCSVILLATLQSNYSTHAVWFRINCTPTTGTNVWHYVYYCIIIKQM